MDPISKRHLSQSEVARRLDVSRVTIVGWESGRYHPRARIADLAALYGTTTDALLGVDHRDSNAEPIFSGDPNVVLQRRFADFIPVKAVPVLKRVPEGPLWLKEDVVESEWLRIDSPVDYALEITDDAMAAGGLKVGDRVYCVRVGRDGTPARGALAVVVRRDRTVLRYVTPQDGLTKGPGEKPEALAPGERIDAIAVKVERPAPVLPE